MNLAETSDGKSNSPLGSARTVKLCSIGAGMLESLSGATVKVAGFDNIAAVQQLLKEGRIAATADQHGDKLAVYGIEYALAILKGETTPQDRQTPVDVIAAAK